MTALETMSMDELVAAARRADEAEAERTKANERYQLVLKASGMGAWDWDIQADTLVWDERMKELFDVGDDFDPHAGFRAFFERINPEDQPWVKGAIDHALEAKRCFHVRYRVPRSNGDEWLVEAKGYGYLRDDDPIRMLGVCWLAEDGKGPGVVNGRG